MLAPNPGEPVVQKPGRTGSFTVSITAVAQVAGGIEPDCGWKLVVKRSRNRREKVGEPDVYALFDRKESLYPKLNVLIRFGRKM